MSEMKVFVSLATERQQMMGEGKEMLQMLRVTPRGISLMITTNDYH